MSKVGARYPQLKLREMQFALMVERYRSMLSELIAPGISRGVSRSPHWPWLPDGLTLVRLARLARVQSGITVDGSRVEGSDSIDVPYLRVANVQGEELDLSEVKRIKVPQAMADRSRLHAGDVVMTEANGNPDNLGRGAVWRGQIPEMVHQNHVFAIKVDKRRLLPEYLSAVLASSHGRKYFRFTSTQVGIATTSSGKVLAMPIPLWELEQQAQIVAECEELRQLSDNVSSKLRSQVSVLGERRRALITAAVTGQIDVSTARGVEVS